MKILVDWLLCTNNISLGEDGGTRFNSLKIHDLGTYINYRKVNYSGFTEKIATEQA